MGHSFGCIVVSATLAGPGCEGKLVRPVDSVVLVQGALSHWSFCTEIPYGNRRRGYFRPIIADQKIAGPLITTQSKHDWAVGNKYPLAAGVAGQDDLAPGDFPRYGALGTHGAQGKGLAVDTRISTMLPVDRSYGFQKGMMYNLDASEFIANWRQDFFGGAHNDIAQPEVAHAVWQAAIASYQ